MSQRRIPCALVIDEASSSPEPFAARAVTIELSYSSVESSRSLTRLRVSQFQMRIEGDSNTFSANQFAACENATGNAEPKLTQCAWLAFQISPLPTSRASWAADAQRGSSHVGQSSKRVPSVTIPGTQVTIRGFLSTPFAR